MYLVTSRVVKVNITIVNLRFLYRIQKESYLFYNLFIKSNINYKC